MCTQQQMRMRAFGFGNERNENNNGHETTEANKTAEENYSGFMC